MGAGKAGLVRGLYAVIDGSYLATDDFPKAARAIIAGGGRLVQVRAKGLSPEALARGCRAVREEIPEDALFIVNDSVAAALASRADGVHLGQSDGSAKEARRTLGAGAVIGVSTHNLTEARRAALDGADYVSFGPIFPTRTKKDAQKVQGLASLERFAPEAGLPVVAIGGITEQTARSVIEHGALAVAIISDILLSGDIEAKTASIISTLGKTGTKG